MQRFQTKEILVLYLHIFIVILWFKSDTGVSMRYLSVKNTRGALHKCMNASSESHLQKSHSNGSNKSHGQF